MAKKPAFCIKTARVAGKAAAGAEHAVAGNDDGKGVVSDRAADGAGTAAAGFFGKMAVCHGMPVGDAHKLPQDLLPERRSGSASGAGCFPAK